MVLRAALFLLFYDAGHGRDMPERAFKHGAVEDPFLKFVAEDVGCEKLGDVLAADG
jgi:hypothetical protein